MVNFYHRFIPDDAQIMLTLVEALANKPKMLLWNTAMVNAFNHTKKTLAEATLLTHPQHGIPITLTTDTSDQAVGAVLQEFVKGSWIPLAFFSKKLQLPQRKQSTFDWELLALYVSVCHFRYFLEGQRFIAFTDHKPFTFCMAKFSDPWFDRQ